MPDAQSPRTPAQWSESLTHLKQIAWGMYQFLTANGHYPADIRDEDGRPLLSWRVRILPLMGLDERAMPPAWSDGKVLEALSREFRLDEPWDGPHNRGLLDAMPAAYTVPGRPAGPGMTFHRGFSGAGALFDPAVPRGLEIMAIRDGPQHTISLIEAREAVPWTRPDSEIPFPSEQLMEALPSGGFLAIFCDGSVGCFDESIDPDELGAFITRNDRRVFSHADQDRRGLARPWSVATPESP